MALSGAGSFDAVRDAGLRVSGQGETIFASFACGGVEVDDAVGDSGGYRGASASVDVEVRSTFDTSRGGVVGSAVLHSQAAKFTNTSVRVEAGQADRAGGVVGESEAVLIGVGTGYAKTGAAIDDVTWLTLRTLSEGGVGDAAGVEWDGFAVGSLGEVSSNTVDTGSIFVVEHTVGNHCVLRETGSCCIRRGLEGEVAE